MSFCFRCANKLSLKLPDGDNRMRLVCDSCGYILYENPKVVVGTIPVYEDKILLCKRAIEPQYSKWTLPAGFMELEESVEEAASRETQEEAGINIQIQHQFCTYSVTKANQVHIYYIAKMLNTDMDPGPETLEAKLVAHKDIPWDDIAFSSVTFALKRFLEQYPNTDGVHISN